MTLLFLQAPVLSRAHGGEHEKATPTAKDTAQAPVALMEAAKENDGSAISELESDRQAFEDSIYGEDDEETAVNDLGEYGLGEEELSPLHSDTNHLTDSIPAADSHEGMDMGGGAEQGKHAMQDIELATHEWVSRSRKGYPAALGITLLAGLVYGFLALKRPFE